MGLEFPGDGLPPPHASAQAGGGGVLRAQAGVSVCGGGCLTWGPASSDPPGMFWSERALEPAVVILWGVPGGFSSPLQLLSKHGGGGGAPR